jgi:putative transposase
MVSLSAKRCGVRYLVGERGYSQRRGCALVKLARSSCRYLPRPREDEARLTERIRKLAWENKAYGYRGIAVLFQQEGSRVNVKRVHRIWKREGLQVPRRKSRKRSVGPRGMTLSAERPNQVWTYDFLEDRTEDGKKLRILTVLDECTQECLAIVVDSSIIAEKVVGILNWRFLTRGVPEHIRNDNGPKFVAKAARKWLREKGCKAIYITPSSPWEPPTRRDLTTS